jgi:hypothetical protein
MRQSGIYGQEHGDEHERDLRLEQQPPTVDRVGERAPDERDAHQGNERAEAEQADRERRVGQLEDLVRDRDEAELAADHGDRLADPEPAEGRRLPQRPRVELEPAEVAENAGALGSDERFFRQIGGLGRALLGQA